MQDPVVPDRKVALELWLSPDGEPFPGADGGRRYRHRVRAGEDSGPNPGGTTENIRPGAAMPRGFFVPRCPVFGISKSVSYFERSVPYGKRIAQGL